MVPFGPKFVFITCSSTAEQAAGQLSTMMQSLPGALHAAAAAQGP
jgi:hypothetical protein